MLTKKDYLLSAFIGFSFSIFLIPILGNILKIKFDPTNPAYLVVILALIALFTVGLFIADLIARKIAVVMQIAKFGQVGLFNTFLDWGVVNLLMSATAIFAGFWFAIFNVISFVIANIASFFWNKNWIFASKEKDVAKGFVQFFVVSLVGMGVKVGIASLVVTVIGTQFGISKELWANVGLAFATAFSMIWNFLGYKFIVFKK